MLTERFVLIHKDNQVLDEISSKLSGFCSSMEYKSERVLCVDSYMNLEELTDVCKNSGIKIFSAEKDALNVNDVLDKINDTGLKSLSSEEFYFLTSGMIK